MILNPFLPFPVLTRRRAEEPELTIHEEIHRRQLVALQCPSSPTSSFAESFDSMASYVRAGTEKIGVNFDSMESTDKAKIALLKTYEQEDEDERRAEFDRIKWCEDEETAEAGTTTDDEESDCEETNDEEDVSDEEQGDETETTVEYELERYEVEINVCSTPDGWWGFGGISA